MLELDELELDESEPGTQELAELDELEPVELDELGRMELDELLELEQRLEMGTPELELLLVLGRHEKLEQLPDPGKLELEQFPGLDRPAKL